MTKEGRDVIFMTRTFFLSCEEKKKKWLAVKRYLLRVKKPQKRKAMDAT
jgi:hypothetical protein